MAIYLKLISSLCVMIIFCISPAFAEIGGYTEQIRIQRIKEFMQSMDKPVFFYGKVIDDNGSPVSDVLITVGVHQSAGIKKIRVSTNSAGLFEIDNEIGYKIFIKNLEKAGYEYDIKVSDTENSYEYDGTFVPDRNNPVVFKVRKKLPPTVVVPGKISVVFTPKKKIKYYEVDLVEMIDDKPYDLQRYHGNHAHADLKARLEHEEGAVFYTFMPLQQNL